MSLANGLCCLGCIELLDTGAASAMGSRGGGQAIAAAQQADIRVWVVDGAGLAGVEALGINPDLDQGGCGADQTAGQARAGTGTGAGAGRGTGTGAGTGGRGQGQETGRDGDRDAGTGTGWCACVDGMGLELRKRLSALIDQVTRTG